MTTDWAEVRVREISERPATYGVVKAGAFVSDGIPMVRGGDIKAGRIGEDLPQINQEKHTEYSRTQLELDDVLIALVGYPGESAVVPHALVGANISRAVGLLRLNSTVDARFVVQYLNSPIGRKRVLAPSAGSAQVVVNLSALNALSLRLPRSLEEQRAIAEALSDADALIESLERLIAKKRAIKQGAMQDLLSGKRRLPGFTAEWRSTTLGAVARIKTGSCNTQDRRVDGDYPFFIRSQHVERIRHATHNCEAILVPGEGGIGSIFHYYRGRFSVHQRVYAVTDFHDSAVGKFVYYWMRHAFGAHAMEHSVKATVDSLRLPTFLKFGLPWPSLDEQHAIATVLTDMDDELDALSTQLDKAHAIKRGMMQQLLTGRIRLV